MPENKIIELPLDINCVSHWTVEDAMRELLQNAIDQGEYDIKTQDNYIDIRSTEAILSIESLLIGRTTKKEESIGGFGEGYKMAIYDHF